MQYGVPGESNIYHVLPGLEHRLPVGAIPILAERPNPDAIFKEDGTWDFPAFNITIQNKQREILDGSDAIMDAVTAKYSKNEKLSWPKQEKEANDLKIDPNAEAPTLRGIAARRGIDLMVLVEKVLKNVVVAELITGDVLGQQQSYEDLLKLCTTVEEVEQIVVTYVLPDLPEEV